MSGDTTSREAGEGRSEYSRPVCDRCGGEGIWGGAWYICDDCLHTCPLTPEQERVRFYRIILDEACRDLGPDEMAVLSEVAEGLRLGRDVYGELRLDLDQRDFERELLDEVRDGLVYVAAAVIRRRRGGS